MTLRHQERESAAASAQAPAASGTAARQALDAVAAVSQLVAGNLELETVFHAAMQAAAAAMKAEACSILLKRSDEDCLRFHLVEGPKTSGLAEAGLPIDDHSIAGWVAGHRRPLLIPEACRDPRFNPAFDARTGFRTRSVIAVPLEAKGRLLGVMQILNRIDGRTFDRDDLELAQTVSSLIAVAIYNAEEHEARLKAERLATIGQTVAGMAHCIKNILNGVQAGSFILDQHLPAEEDSGVARGWKIVKRNMGLLSNIVLDMLSYAKQRKPLLQPCRIGDVCQDVVALLGPLAGEKGVTLAAGGDAGEAWIDEAGIKRCLINLVGNAVDACAAGGSVRIEATAAAGPGCFALSVRDNGSGIDPAAAEHIFEPFFSTKGGKGTGLGLAVTRKIVEEHGGRISVQSTPGCGTEFTLVLPVRPAQGETG